MRFLCFALACSLAVAGCAASSPAHTPTGPAPTASSAPAGQAQSEEAAIKEALEQVKVQSQSKTDYKIGGTDLIEIKTYQQPDLDRKIRVSQNGTVSLPLVGLVKVGGLSLNEAEAAISDKLKDFVINPQVTLFILEYGNKKIFLLGEVAKPGSYELPTEAKLTVLEAISLAGGFSAIAAPDRTKVIRTVNGQSQSFFIEVSAITKRGQKEKDMTLEPNDVVYVPQSFF